MLVQRRRQKRKQGVLDHSHDNEIEHASKKIKETPENDACKKDESVNNENISKSSRRRKKKKKNSTINNDDQTTTTSDKKGQYLSNKFTKGSVKPPVPKKNEINAEMRMSDKRMEAYGISSNTFKRKKMKEKYRQGTQ